MKAMDTGLSKMNMNEFNGNSNMKYNAIYQRLAFETAVIIFNKASGETRVMLGTRNPKTVTLSNCGDDKSTLKLNSHDKRCNISNGNISVMDLEIGDCRAFNVDRVIDIYFVGQIMTESELDEEIKKLSELKQRLNGFYGGNV